MIEYADPLINILDESKQIPYRLYREHCQQTSNGYIKNLSRLGRDLKNVIIIDNSPISYSKHTPNSLPIISWFDDVGDNELSSYIPILEVINKFNDVRTVIPQIVINDQISHHRFNAIFRERSSKQKVDSSENTKKGKSNEKINKFLTKHAKEDNRDVKIAKPLSHPIRKETVKWVNKFNEPIKTSNLTFYSGDFICQTTKKGSKRSSKFQCPINNTNEKTPSTPSSKVFNSANKVSGMKPYKGSNKLQLLKFDASAKEEILIEDSESKNIPLYTCKTPLLINSLFHSYRANSISIEKEIKAKLQSSPNHPLISKKLDPKVLGNDTVQFLQEKPIYHENAKYQDKHISFSFTEPPSSKSIVPKLLK